MTTTVYIWQDKSIGLKAVLFLQKFLTYCHSYSTAIKQWEFSI